MGMHTCHVTPGVLGLRQQVEEQDGFAGPQQVRDDLREQSLCEEVRLDVSSVALVLSYVARVLSSVAQACCVDMSRRVQYRDTTCFRSMSTDRPIGKTGRSHR